MANEDWMSGFTDRRDLSLVDLCLPASHDAGVSDDHYYPYGKLSSKASTIAQAGNIKKQLEWGSRFFDLRIAKKGTTLQTFHGEGVFGGTGGGWGQPAESIFEEAHEFIKEHTGEIVILRISHTEGKHDVGSLLRNTIRQSRLYCSGTGVNPAIEPLPDLKGKILAIFDEDALPTANPGVGLHHFSKYKPNGKGLMICGKYAGIMAGLHKMVQKTVTAANEHGTHQKFMVQDHLFQAYWQLAFNIREKSMNKEDRGDGSLAAIDSTAGTHYNLDYFLNAHRGKMVSAAKDSSGKNGITPAVTPTNKHWHRPNLINLDFISERVCNKIIAFNAEMLPRQTS